jgi:hypothetical protein
MKTNFMMIPIIMILYIAGLYFCYTFFQTFQSLILTEPRTQGIIVNREIISFYD